MWGALLTRPAIYVQITASSSLYQALGEHPRVRLALAAMCLVVHQQRAAGKPRLEVAWVAACLQKPEQKPNNDGG